MKMQKKYKINCFKCLKISAKTKKLYLTHEIYLTPPLYVCMYICSLHYSEEWY
jgi:hypothetical protein